MLDNVIKKWYYETIPYNQQHERSNKMKRIKRIAKPLCMLALLGTLPLASAAGVTAKPSNHQLYVNGIRADAAAWLINGNNYFKLRDLGRLADFGVTYDSKTNGNYSASRKKGLKKIGKWCIIAISK